MKKTLTVNLNNIVFHIDDDAYEMLQTYLADVSRHLSDDERNEVMNDIEARIAELFTERLQKNKNVVNLTDVEEIINILGKPSQYANDEESDSTEASKTGKKRARRFYRDSENAVLGGVAAGVAAYFSWDVTWVRIAFVILALISAGNVIPVYLLVWIIAPKAVTVSQRLEMQGEDVTIENIKSEINNVKNYVESEKFKQSASNFGDKFVEIVRAVFKALFGFLGAVLGFAGMIIVGVLIIALMFLIFDPAVFHDFSPHIATDWSLITPDKIILLIVSLLLVIGCPIFMLVYWAIRAISGRREFSKTTSWVVLILWLAGLFMFYSVGARTIIHWNKTDGRNWTFNWTHSDSPVIDEVRYSEPFHGIDISGNIELIFTQDSVRKVSVSAPGDLMPYIKSEVKDGILKVYTDKAFFNNDIKLYVSNDSIFSFEASGASQISSTSQIKTSRLELDLSGASQARLNLNVGGLFEADLSGASYANIDGTANNIETDVNGASKIEADELITRYAVVESSGASHARVYATESIDARASGAGQIECKGKPKNVRKSENFGSNVVIE
jgi:phage shock protein PspC (stress-responsive transcriptional regulator)